MKERNKKTYNKEGHIIAEESKSYESQIEPV